MSKTLRYSFLKKIILSSFFISIVLFSCKSVEVPVNRKIITGGDFKEEFFVTNNTPRAKVNRYYYWFKSRQVHQTEGNYSGNLLDGDYTKYYYTNQLAEKGVFENGLKTGEWSYWHANGRLLKKENWFNGWLTGKVITRDSTGAITSIGKYVKGEKSGKWIYPKIGDTVNYKTGVLVNKDTLAINKPKKKSFFKRIFSKKDKETKKRLKGNSKPEKDGFLKRIFKKKDNTNKKRVVKSETKKQSNKKSKKGSSSTRTESIKNKNVNSKKVKRKKEKTKKDGFFKRLFSKKNKAKENKM